MGDRPGQPGRRRVCSAPWRPPASSQVPGIAPCPALHSGLREHASAEMPETGRAVPDMHESLSRYDVTVTVGYQGGSLPTRPHSLQQPTRRHDTGPQPAHRSLSTTPSHRHVR